MSITMKDVAEHAGVSLGTVSNYINGKQNVTEAKRKKVENSILKLGYKVNEVARCLKTNSFKTIGVLIPSFSNVYLVKVVSNVETILRKMNYSMLVVSSEGDAEKEKELMMYLAQRCDGILYSPNQVGDYDVEFYKSIQQNTPIVTLNERLIGVECDGITVDNCEVTRQAVKECIAKGHKNIAMIVGTKGLFTTKGRVNGYKIAIKESGLTYDENMIKYCSYSRLEGQNLTNEIISENSNVTAILTCGYRLTLGALTAVNDIGQSKVNIIGFDAEEIEYIVTPKLCYVSQPNEEIAQSLVDTVMFRLNEDFNAQLRQITLIAEVKNTDSITTITE